MKSAGKVMATVCWDARDIIHIDYLLSKQAINSDYYATLLDRFNNILKKKRPHLVKKKVLFHQDNAQVPAYVPGTNGQIQRISLRIASPYSPDLVPCDDFLFPNLKKWFGGKRFITREHETEAYFEGLDKSYYSDGLKKLENRWIKYIAERRLLRNKNESIKKNVFLKTY